MTDYVSLRGKVYLAEVINGIAGPIKWRGNMPALEIAISGEVTEHHESWSGNDALDDLETSAQAVTWSGTIEALTEDNQALILNGTSQDITGGTITNKSLGTVVAGQEIMVGEYNLSDVVIKDSSATPATVDTSKYELDAPFGTIKFIDVTGLTMPLTLSATSGTATATTIGTDLDREYMLYFKGINKRDHKKVALELWRIRKDADSTFPLINTEMASYDVSGRCLADDTKALDPKMGPFGRFVRID